MMRCTGLWMLVVALFLVAGVLGSCQRAPDATDMAGRLDMTGRPDWSAVADTPGAAQLTPYRFLAIRKCAVPPVIDGKLDDVCWNSAEQASDFVLLHADRAAEQQTTAYLAYDDFRIYFGFMCAERQIDEIVAEEREHDALVCHDDCVELFLDLNRDYLNYFHFIVNSLGVTSDASVELVDDFIDVYYDWEPEYDVSAAQGDGYWVVEMAIPFTSLKTGVARPSIYGERKREEESALTLLESPRVDTGTVWNINLCRRKPGEGGELSSWAPVCDKFYSPYQFGHLAFADNLAPGDVSLLRHNAQRIHARVVLEERRREQERLKPILDEIDSYVSNCNWVATYRRNMFLGYQSEDGEFGIPNYARRDGQGRVVLQEAFPPLSKEIIEGIAAKETPRLVFDRESLAELQGKIHTCPRIGAQWLTLQGEVDQLLEEAICGFEPCEMQWDRNCVARDKAKRAGAGYGLLCTMRSKCALAYGITGDRRYAEKTWEAQKALIEHFARYQVFRAASNWYSIWDASYEVYTSTYVYDMIADAGVMTQKEKGELIEFIRRLGYSVDYCVKHSAMIGNHQFMWTGNFGCLVSYFPEFPEHERWARDVEARMAALYADILRDGGQVERSPGHHVFGLSFLCRYVNTRRHVTGEDHFARKYDGRSLEMAVDWMAKIATPLGEIPAINDSKRPKLSSHTFVLDVVNRFNKGEYLVAGKIETENLPLEHLISESVVPAEPEYASVLLPDTGWAIMRDSWSKDSRYLLFDYGPHGAWHGHYDKMNIVMYADGVGWVLDAGASPHYCVYIKEHNEWHKQTISHNTVLVDDRSQDAVTGILRRWESQKGFDLVSASHTGYENVKHTRSVFHPRGEYFIINDYLEPSDSEEHDYGWLLHVYGELEKCDEYCITFTKEDRKLLILPAEPTDFTSVDLKEGLCIDTSGERQKPQRDDGKWEPGDPGWAYIPYVVLRKDRRTQDVNYTVVLYPHRGVERPGVRCRRLTGEDGTASGVLIAQNAYEDVYGERIPGAQALGDMQLGGFRTDADYFFARIQGDEIVKAIAVGGSYLYWKGGEVAAEVYR